MRVFHRSEDSQIDLALANDYLRFVRFEGVVSGWPTDPVWSKYGNGFVSKPLRVPVETREIILKADVTRRYKMKEIDPLTSR